MGWLLEVKNEDERAVVAAILAAAAMKVSHLAESAEQAADGSQGKVRIRSFICGFTAARETQHRATFQRHRTEIYGLIK
jgi:hypothetical protein